jgi:IS30 family transposase
MKGMTVSEMMKALNLPRKTIEMRLFRRGHKPLSYEAVYSKEAFEDIKKSPGKGRPKKQESRLPSMF